jgi:hypothetical protein
MESPSEESQPLRDAPSIVVPPLMDGSAQRFPDGRVATTGWVTAGTEPAATLASAA